MKYTDRIEANVNGNWMKGWYLRRENNKHLVTFDWTYAVEVDDNSVRLVQEK